MTVLFLPRESCDPNLDRSLLPCGLKVNTNTTPRMTSSTVDPVSVTSHGVSEPVPAASSTSTPTVEKGFTRCIRSKDAGNVGAALGVAARSAMANGVSGETVKRLRYFGKP